MCFHHKPKGKRKTGDVIIDDVAVAKNLTDKEYVKFINDATEEATKKGMTLEGYLQEIAELLSKLKKYKPIKNKFPNEALPKNGKFVNYEIKDGLIILENNIKTVNSIDYVITLDGKLLLGKKHHFLGNKLDVFAAGDLKIVNGYIKKLSNASGHYFPNIKESENFSKIFKLMNLNLEKAWMETFWEESGRVFNKSLKIN